MDFGIDAWFLIPVIFIVFLIAREIGLRLSPLWLAIMYIYKEYDITGCSNVCYVWSANSLQQYRRYASNDGADKCLAKLIKSRTLDAEDMIRRLNSNEILQSQIYDALAGAFENIKSIYAGSIRRRLKHHWLAMIDDTYPLDFCLVIRYISPAGRNRYQCGYLWNKRELARYKPSRVETSSGRQFNKMFSSQLHESEAHNRIDRDFMQIPVHAPTVDPVRYHDKYECFDNVAVDTNGGMAAPRENTLPEKIVLPESSPVAKVRGVTEENTLFGGRVTVQSKYLTPECWQYLQKYKYYTEVEYRRKARQRQKTAISGCYIIYNTVTDKVYVGQAKSLLTRVLEHLNGKKSGGEALDYDIFVRRHEAWIKQVPLGVSGYLDLNEMERDLIKAFNCVEPKGYNKTRGNGY